ncbi:MAG: hypothetical protein Q8P92_04510 [Candidatus Daviesbacteria bacterium]|nr:hypothetical protein [Candidatus Daviesbacteria bacterium]
MEVENTEQNKPIQSVPETPQLKRNLMNQKGITLILILIIVIVLVIAGFYYYQKYSTSSQTLPVNKTTSSSSSTQNTLSLELQVFRSVSVGKILYKKTVFNSLTDQYDELIQLDLKTGEKKVLISSKGNKNTNMGNLQLSPDNKKLAYHLEDQLIVRDMTTGTEVNILQDVTSSSDVSKNRHYYPLAWSPDSKRLLFTIGVWESSMLGIIDADGKNLRIVTDSQGRQTGCPGATWSPDSKKIIVYSYGYGHPCTSFMSGLYVITIPDSGELVYKQIYSQKTGTPGKILLDPSVGFATWSPDGNKILFTRDIQKENSTTLDMSSQNSLVDSDGKNLIDVEKIGSLSTIWLDNDRVFYSDNLTGTIGTYNVTTVEKKVVLIDKNNISPVSLSPDKKYLIYTTYLKLKPGQTTYESDMTQTVNTNAIEMKLGILNLDTQEIVDIDGGSMRRKATFIGWTNNL